MTKKTVEFNPKRYETSISRLMEIFKDISETVNRVSTWRCPYKNAQDLCTANFACRNKRPGPEVGELPLCTGSDNLDFRDAWESNGSD